MCQSSRTYVGAGESAGFGVDFIHGNYNTDTIECIHEVIEHYKLNANNTHLKLNGIYKHGYCFLYRGYIYVDSSEQKYGYIEILNYFGITSRFKIYGGIVTKLQ